jgi:hypothetical protein
MMNKRGQDLSTSTIILIILGVAVLVILIIGFTTGWSTFKNLISPTNVDSVVSDCSTACGTAQTYSFCSAQRTLRVNEDKLEVKTSCAVLASASNFAKYHIGTCSSIQCSLSCSDIVIDSKAGTAGTSGKYDVSSLAGDLTAGQKCIIN